MVTICTVSLTFNNSTFCPHSVFMCFVWISEQTAIVSLYSINWLVCITETQCVYCTVRAGLQVWCKLFSSLQTLPWGRRPFAGLSTCMPRFDARSIHLSFMVSKVAEGQFSVTVLPFSPFSIIPPTPQTRLHLNVALTRRKNGQRLRTFPKEKLFRKFGSFMSLFFLFTS